MLINEKIEKDVIFKLFNRYENIISQSQKVVFFTMPEECKLKHLKKLLDEIILNAYDYPKDKLCRWIGYIHGVLSCANILDDETLKSIFSFDNSISYESIINKSRNIYSLLDNNSGIVFKVNITFDNRFKSKLISTINESFEGFNKGYYNNVYQHQVIGYIQGILTCFNLINVENERNYTRPLLHSYHNEKIKSF